MKRILALVVMLSGCESTTTTPPTNVASSAVSLREESLATTQPAYWLDQEGSAIASSDFDRLWQACDDAARDFMFKIDRSDYRGGVLTTEPMTSRQWFELWRPDVRAVDDLNESSLATTRRTVRFEINKQADGSFQAIPKVLVERLAIAEQRLTSVVNYRSVFSLPKTRAERARGTRESDTGIFLPGKYWYAVGRDRALESALVDSVQKKLSRN